MKLKTLILFLLMPLVSMALTPAEALQKTAAKINSAPALTAAYTATYSEGGSTNGFLTISKKRFAMTSKAYGVWYDGTDMWSYSQQTGETSITTPTEAELLETNPLEIINHYADNFTAGNATSKGALYTVTLTAKDKKNTVKKATLIIDTATWLPTAINATFSNGTSIDIAINSITQANTLPAKSVFQYPANDYPEAEVVDLR